MGYGFEVVRDRLIVRDLDDDDEFTVFCGMEDEDFERLYDAIRDRIPKYPQHLITLCHKARKRRIKAGQASQDRDRASFHEGFASAMYDILQFLEGEPANLEKSAGCFQYAESGGIDDRTISG